MLSPTQEVLLSPSIYVGVPLCPGSKYNVVSLITRNRDDALERSIETVLDFVVQNTSWDCVVMC